MVYIFDTSYLDYYRSAAQGNYDSGLFEDRFRFLKIALAITTVGGIRIIGRVINEVIEAAKVIFWGMTSLLTFGKYGNFDRLRSHCKLLAFNTCAFPAQPLQFSIHILSIAIGIIYPKAAYRIMQVASTPLTLLTCQEKIIKQQYKNSKFYSQSKAAFLNYISSYLNKSSNFLVKVVGNTLINEFSDSLDAALVAPIGYMDSFHVFGANTHTLTKEQKRLTPILLLNGNYSHQGTFLPLLHFMHNAGNKRPVYTLNLPSDCNDVNLIITKMKEIKVQYNISEIEIDVVGHSMGSWLIQQLGYYHLKKMDGFHLGRIITIGTPIEYPQYFESNKVFDIMGTRDVLCKDKSLLSKEHYREIDTGHLGLLSHPKSLQAIQTFLN